MGIFLRYYIKVARERKIQMNVWTIIPVKKLENAKSSLRSVIKDEIRRKLVLAMLSDVIRACKGCRRVERTIVVSPDEIVLEFAEKNGALSLKEPGLELNEAVKLAIKHAEENGAQDVLILPADLPLLKSTELEQMISMADERCVVIAPSKTNGTNALLISPPSSIEPKFGGESFPRHLQEAKYRGVKVKIYHSPTVSFDLDFPEDILKVMVEGTGTETAKVISEFVNKDLTE
ncbi:MAG: 2-phospho-L-lactate guanylyltransferase [Candidatus Hadarchaeales archaeon]